MERAAIVEVEPEGRITKRVRIERSIVDEQCAGETGLYDDVIAGVDVGDDQLRATPGTNDTRPAQLRAERPRFDFAQHVGFANDYRDDLPSPDRCVEVAGDRLGFRKLGHCASAPASRCRGGAVFP
jgi:hypothetical protein